MKNKFFVFDLDGTIVNSSDTVLNIINRLRKSYDLDLMHMCDEVHHYIGVGGIKMIKKFFPSNMNHQKLLSDFRNLYETWDLKGEALCKNVLYLLNFLKNKNCNLALLTNKPKKLTLKTLQYHGLIKFFDCIVTLDDVINKKPDPEGIEIIINFYNLTYNQIIYFGDTKVDLLLSSNLFLDFYMFNRNCYDKVKVATYMHNGKDFKYYQFGDYTAILKKIV